MTRFLRLMLTAALTLAAATLGNSTPTRAADDPLAGFWRYRVAYPHTSEGPLTVSREGKGWRATIAGVSARTDGPGSALRFVFPAGHGEYRGSVARDGRSIRGYRVQPSGAGPDRPFPAPAGQPFATPLTLASDGRGGWTGVARPLPDEFTVWLRIARDADGVLTAAYRNPEYNTRGGASLFRVAQSGDEVTFTAGDPAHPDARLTARLIPGPERLRVRWRELGQDIDLVRVPQSETAGFYPRPPGGPAYVYRRPAQLADGWPTARARDVGLNEAMLTRLIQRLIDADPAVRRPALVHSILVARRGRLVLEEYFFGQDRDTLHDTRSAGKTFSAVMLGAVMHDGLKIGPDTAVYPLMASRGPFANPDPRKAAITLGQLMSHTSGLACDDNDEASPGGEEALQNQTAQPDWWKQTLDLPVAHLPDSRYAYCSPGMNLVGGALTTASGEWLPELFDRTIARPLGFGPWFWNLQPNGEGYQGGGAYLRPRDLLKIGQLYADGGVWKGRRLIDADWIKASTAPHADVTPDSTGLSEADFASVYTRGQDGYAWHLSTLTVGDRRYREYAATGNGGQLLIVVPDLDLVVVFTAGNYGQGGIWGHFRDQIVPNDIIAGIRN
jgi:CubicO group peptidase (beta-lactamase class C family)